MSITDISSDVLNRLTAVRHRIAKAAMSVGRDSSSITLVAVSKFHSRESILEAVKADQYIFGENRVQEATVKFSPIQTVIPDLRVHLIGSLQTNKVRDAIRIAHVIESLDRLALVEALDRAAQAEGYLPDLLVQVTTGNEPQKHGVPIEEADYFIDVCCQRFGNKLRGLMCIPPIGVDPIPHFVMLRKLAQTHGLEMLSMGMSADFEQAIIHGATHVRIGSAIFGARSNP